MKIVVTILFLILLCPMVMAQEQIQVKNAGITPDSVFYNLDRALEKLQLRFNKNNQARIMLQLRFLDERIQEIKAMVKKENSGAITIAISERNQIMNNVETESQAVGETVKNQIRQRLELHTQEMEKIQGEEFENQIANVIQNNNQLKNKLQEE